MIEIKEMKEDLPRVSFEEIKNSYTKKFDEGSIIHELMEDKKKEDSSKKKTKEEIAEGLDTVAKENISENTQVKETVSENSAVNHPSYYNVGNIEVIDFIDDKQLDFCLGNAVKYICRAGRKNPETEIQDLEKAIWYISWKIDRIKAEKNI